MIFVLLKRNGPSLRTLAEPEAEVKVVKLCFKKKKVLSKQIPLLQVSLFSSILIQTTGEHRYSWAAAQGGETQGSSHKSGGWQAEIPGPSSSSSCQPRGWWNETPGSSSNTCNPGTEKNTARAPGKARDSRRSQGAPGAPDASLEPNRNAAGGPRKQSLPARGQLKLRTFKLFL